MFTVDLFIIIYYSYCMIYTNRCVGTKIIYFIVNNKSLNLVKKNILQTNVSGYLGIIGNEIANEEATNVINYYIKPSKLRNIL